MGADLPEITAEAAGFCTECGQALPAPGDACPSCPQLDARRVTSSPGTGTSWTN
jgi:hypothetical protein